jgi:uncharacterized protein
VPAISRRTAIKGLAAVAGGAAVGLAIDGYAFGRHQLTVVRTDLPITGLGSGLDGLRVGYVSDLHHSEFVTMEDIRRAASLMAAERPDLILLGGDYVSYGNLRYAEPCAEVLGTLHAPLGVFAVLGNHDDDRYVPDALRRRGIGVLRDESTTIVRRGDSLILTGIRFWTRGPADIARAVGPRSAPVLLAAHDPRRILEAAALHIPGVISGHTHGGQVVLPVVGALAARKFPVAAGRLSRDGCEMFVSRGVGTVIVPIRVNCPPEVNLVTLRRRESAV